ncbi:CAAX amino protease [Paenibacillus silvae]|uniref:CAAX amino protease n=1 Tax=Paenibacillus silvae TaxID=1325358 RepID=A0ABQ1Z8M6_9BACL|nr:type II CAAX endopeptidase family protein [Paenibacillus silvae]GGH51899.1 CAAX amino protease [Paenibacillus silvae]
MKKKMRTMIQFPLIWVITGLVFLGVSSFITQRMFTSTEGIMSIVLALAGSALSIAIYILIMKLMAGRKVQELHMQRAVSELVFGAGVGSLLIAVSALIIMLLGGYSFTWSQEHAAGSIIALAIGAAVVEELIFRGLFLQAIEKRGGSWIALAVTSLFFGLAHLPNPGATLWSSIAIVIEAGILLGAGFLWRRNLWFVIGLHFAWNAVEGLLGIPVSGIVSQGFFDVELSGPALLTGGSFGLEASIVPVMISLVIAIPMLIRAHRKGQIYPRK